MRITEIDHEYQGPQIGDLKPLRDGDRVRLYHGFRSFKDAVSAAENGITGAVRADRVYSYEGDNNPKGLFVTMNFEVAEQFIGAHGAQVVMEIMADVADLEAPAWPGGTYTVQGQMSQYFGRGAKGRAARRQTQTSDEAETRERSNREAEHYAAVLGSDRAHLAFMLFHTREAQALFVGHLNPEDIAAFHVRPDYNAAWERVTVEEFVSRYGGETKSEKVFGPRDEFDGDLFLKRLSERMGWSDDAILGEAWRDIKKGPNRTHHFVETFGAFLWPKQYAGAINWLRRRYP